MSVDLSMCVVSDAGVMVGRRATEGCAPRVVDHATPPRSGRTHGTATARRRSFPNRAVSK